MMFPSSKQQPAVQSAPHNHSHSNSSHSHSHNSLSLLPLSLLRLLPLFILLTGSPAMAQLSQSREVERQAPATTAVTTEINGASTALHGSAKLESTEQNFASPAPGVKSQGSLSEPYQAKATLDSPPSQEVAATLCEGGIHSLSEKIIITSQTVCQSGLTLPSLWWTKEQVAQELRTSGKLVSDWSAQLKTSDAPGQVRLVVNPQLWSLMDYFERYDFVSNFGLAAKGFGYQTEIYNTKGTRLASYICQVQGDNLESLGSSCKMNLGSSLNFSSRGSRKSFL